MALAPPNYDALTSSSSDESISLSSSPPPNDDALTSSSSSSDESIGESSLLSSNSSYDRTAENLDKSIPDESIGKSSLPPPSYAALMSSSYDRTAEKNTETETYIHTDQNVAAVRFARRCDTFSAPDMLLDGLKNPDKKLLKAKINGRSVEYTAMPVLSLEAGKGLLIEYARARLKLPTKVARKSIIKSTEYEIAFRYKLLTQIERRVMESRTKPYRGEKISTYHPCSTWDHTIDRSRSFQEEECYFKVPSTEKIITCKLCEGNGKGRCTTCGGAGQKMCTRCHGFGQEPMSKTECLKCGDGFETCRDCHGGGIGKCVECEGRGKVISYQRLKVIWTVAEYVYVDPIDGVPSEQLVQAKGRLIHKDVCDGHVKPIIEDELFHSKIVRDSARQIARSRDIEGTVCKQSQTVHLVLAQRFDCQYKEKSFSFHVIGTEREAYVPYYPNRGFKFLDFLTGKR